MTAPAEGWTLAEARERLVDRELLEAERAATANRAAVCQHPYAVRLAELNRMAHGGGADSAWRRFAPLAEAERSASGEVDRQFWARLRGCVVTGRRGDPTEDARPIPASALPSSDGSSRGRLRVIDWPGSRMAIGHGAGRVVFCDVRVWPPDEDVTAEPVGSRTVSVFALAECLRCHVDDLEPGDPGLTEAGMQGAARAFFRENKVPRQMVRDWIRNDMPPEKRPRRGYRARRPAG